MSGEKRNVRGPSCAETAIESDPMYEVILLAVDGSKHSAATIQAAAEQARAFHSEVVVVHARQLVQSPIPIGVDSIGIPTLAAVEEMTVVEHDLDSAAHRLVDHVVAELASQDIKATGEVVSGQSTARSILEAARECRADLIVVGSRGLSDLTGLLLGSVAHQVVQHAHCAVLVVRAGA